MADGTTLDPIVDKALKQFKLSASAGTDQRRRELEDLAFQVPEKQWPDDVIAQRKSATVDGVPVPARPMLSISQVDQPVQLVQSSQRNAHLGVQIHPVDEDAQDETAEVLQDLYRSIERDSNAEQVRTWAFDRSLKCGMGWYRILPVYADEGQKWDQKIQIRRILNQASVYPDPFAQEADFSDGQFAFITVDMPWERYVREFGTSQLAEYDATEFESLGDLQKGWMTEGDDGAAKTVRVAEYFSVEYDSKTWYLLEDGSETDQKPAQNVPIQNSRKVDTPKVMWRKINCVEVLEETELPGPWIPLVPTIGRELQVFDQERRWAGIYTNAKDAQRLLNYGVSNTVETAALAPKSIWLVAEGQEEGHEAEFALANVRNLPYLRYKPTELKGTIVGPPTRIQASADISAGVALIEQSKQFIQSTTFVHEPSLGQESARAKSGRAILALQQQADAGNSGYLENLAGISMRHEARIILRWIPHYYDRPGRIVRTVRPDQTEVPIMLNQPFVVDPRTKRPVKAQPEAKDAKHYDLRKGMYGVAVTIGKSWQTNRMQSADALGQIIQASPEAMMPILGPLWLQTQDFPMHDEAAELLKKMQPPQLRESKDGQPDPEQLMQENQQLKAAGQELTQIAKGLQQQLETKQVEADNKYREAQLDASARVEIERIKAETQFKLEELKFRHELALQDDQQRHEMGMGAADSASAERQAERQMDMAEDAANAQHVRSEFSAASADARASVQSEREADREDVRARESADREDARSRESADREDAREADAVEAEA